MKFSRFVVINVWYSRVICVGVDTATLWGKHYNVIGTDETRWFEIS
jgi:hypothetical protein